MNRLNKLSHFLKRIISVYSPWGFGILLILSILISLFITLAYNHFPPSIFELDITTIPSEQVIQDGGIVHILEIKLGGEVQPLERCDQQGVWDNAIDTGVISTGNSRAILRCQVQYQSLKFLFHEAPHVIFDTGPKSGQVNIRYNDQIVERNLFDESNGEGIIVLQPLPTQLIIRTIIKQSLVFFLKNIWLILALSFGFLFITLLLSQLIITLSGIPSARKAYLTTIISLVIIMFVAFFIILLMRADLRVVFEAPFEIIKSLLMIFVPVFIYCFACLCFGSLLIWILAGKEKFELSGLTGLVTSFLLGTGILSGLLLIFALLGWFHQVLVIGIMLVSIAFGFPGILPYFKDGMMEISGFLNKFKFLPLGWKLIAVFVIISGASGLLMIRGIGTDLEALHFPIVQAKAIVAAHKLSASWPGQDIIMEIHPIQLYMQMGAIMLLHGVDNSFRMFSWVVYLAGVVLLLLLGTKTGVKQRGKWIIMAMLFSSSTIIPGLYHEVGTNLNSIPLGLAVYFWGLNYAMKPSRTALRLAGLFAGVAIMAKFTYALTIIPGIVVLIVWPYLPGILRINSEKDNQAAGINALRMLSALLRVGLWTLIAVIPFLLKEYMIFGNVLPFLQQGSLGLTHAVERVYTPQAEGFIRIWFPFLISFMFVSGFQYYSLSPLLVAFLPMALFLPRPSKIWESPLFAITISAFVGLIIWWVVMTPQYYLTMRYYQATILVLFPLAAKSAEYILERKQYYKLLAMSISLGTLVILISVWTFYFFGGLFLNLGSTIDYLSKGMPQCTQDNLFYGGCMAIQEINKEANLGDRVYIYSDYYRGYLRADLIQCAYEKEKYSEFKDFADQLETSAHNSNPIVGYSENTEGNDITFVDDDIWKYLYQRGFRYVLIDSIPSHGKDDPLRNQISNPPSWIKLEPIYVAPLDVTGDFAAYRLEFGPNPNGKPVTCNQVHPPAWEVLTPD